MNGDNSESACGSSDGAPLTLVLTRVSMRVPSKAGWGGNVGAMYQMVVPDWWVKKNGSMSGRLKLDVAGAIMSTITAAKLWRSWSKSWILEGTWGMACSIPLRRWVWKCLSSSDKTPLRSRTRVDRDERRTGLRVPSTIVHQWLAG